MRRSVFVFWGLLTVLTSLPILSGCKEDMKDLYEKAMKAYRTEDYQKAVKTFEEILIKYPEHNLTQKVRYELGNLYFYKLKQPHKALKHLQDLYAQTQQGKYALEALKLLGYIYDESQNDCLKGVELYRILLRDYAMDIDAGKYQYTIAECYFKLHDYNQARNEYQSLLDQYPRSSYIPRSKFRIANSYALQEEWGTAIALHEELLRSENLPEQLVIDNKLELAFCYEHEEFFEQALKLYEELKGVNPSSVVIDKSVLDGKIKRMKKLIEESNKEPAEVEWNRRKNK